VIIIESVTFTFFNIKMNFIRFITLES